MFKWIRKTKESIEKVKLLLKVMVITQFLSLMLIIAIFIWLILSQ